MGAPHWCGEQETAEKKDLHLGNFATRRVTDSFMHRVACGEHPAGILRTETSRTGIPLVRQSVRSGLNKALEGQAGNPLLGI